MHTGIISFCDRVGYNIKSSDTKETILHELHGKYQIQILQKHWHKLDAEAVAHLYRSPHFTCLRSNGNPYYMYFTHFDDVPIIFFIDKKIQPGYQVPRIILGRGKWHHELFQGTLMEGEMVKDQYGGWVYLINDVIAYKGEYMWRLTLPERIEYAFRILHECYTPDPILDVCTFQVKRYAHATQEGIQQLLELSQIIPYTSRGIYFWPFSRKFKPKLYNFDESLIKAVTRKVKDNPEFREAPTGPVPADHALDEKQESENTTHSDEKKIDTPHVTENVFWLRKTENPDVYDVYVSANASSQKQGIAHVPSLQMSKMLRSEFKDTTVAMSIPFECIWDEKWQKWLPLRRAPTLNE